ncbi:C2H2-type domain-containing protein [Caenorhabditis elegans]|uniref:C2H2-type domain-containing protein n=1 Tax=Caenorhabditis elegans TaxID=6239 RepID=Q965P0_CAEEL|nr:C2H2-type domain-containing protein [Caenorhabditis elegans]CCD73756.1 C2H2-type domain-containing protein [Caenorhabditis elegans]|eukprot:NP_497439.2 Uncharacterized protein CELE_Y22D7AL.16 [Caenorhabditis elegans]
MSSSEDNRRTKKDYKKRSKQNRERSRSPIARNRSRSTSRGTFEEIDSPVRDRSRTPKAPQFNCRQCRKAFDSIRELAEHEIKNHEDQFNCYHCDKKSESIERLAAHTAHRHGPKPVICAYCQEPFGKSSELMSDDDWDEFRDHIFKETVKKRMYRHGSRNSSQNVSVGGALRGVGSCPHGPPVKCKNFPQCPGAKCIYSHNMCRYEDTCNKSTCPFDHSNRPRTCMTCVNDMKSRRRNY